MCPDFTDYTKVDYDNNNRRALSRAGALGTAHGKLGVDKFRDAYERWMRAKRATDTKSVRVAMDKAIMQLVEAIEAFRNQVKENKVGRRHRVVGLLRGMDSPLLAFMTVKIVMDGLICSQELMPLATKLANYVATEKNVTMMSKQVAPVMYTLVISEPETHLGFEKDRLYIIFWGLALA